MQIRRTSAPLLTCKKKRGHNSLHVQTRLIVVLGCSCVDHQIQNMAIIEKNLDLGVLQAFKSPRDTLQSWSLSISISAPQLLLEKTISFAYFVGPMAPCSQEEFFCKESFTERCRNACSSVAATWHVRFVLAPYVTVTGHTLQHLRTVPNTGLMPCQTHTVHRLSLGSRWALPGSARALVTTIFLSEAAWPNWTTSPVCDPLL